MTIENIVFSGGGFAGIIIHGVFFELINKQYIDIKNIKRIYGTSVGSLLGVIFSLGIDKNILDDYIIKRPLKKLFNIELDIFSNKTNKFGFFDIENIIKEILSPLLTFVGLSEDTTLKELYDKTSIELFLYSVNIMTFEELSLSHNSFPDLKIIKAVSMSCSVPIVFQPIYFNDNHYIDGGLLNHYPLNKCISDLNKIKKNNDTNIDVSDTILSFRVFWNYNTLDIKDMNFISYIFFFIKQMLSKYFSMQDYKNIKNEILIPLNETFISNTFDLLDSDKDKKKLIDEGIKYANIFLDNK